MVDEFLGVFLAERVLGVALLDKSTLDTLHPDAVCDIKGAQGAVREDEEHAAKNDGDVLGFALDFVYE